jgi:thiol:disulfide interchange protein
MSKRRRDLFRTALRSAARHRRLSVAAALAAGAFAALSLTAASLTELGFRSTAIETPGVPEAAAASGVLRDGVARVRARLLVHPDGDDAGVRVGVLLQMDPGWHVYGPDPGDSGLPTTLRWRADRGRVGAMDWPPVETFEELDGLLTTYGYSGEVLLAARLVPDGAAAAVGELRVDVDLLACNVDCVPASFALQREVGSALGSAAAAASEVRRVFARWTPERPTRAASGPDAAPMRLAAALGLAFLGGLVLNLMPCVLPVLAIKLFALADLARRERREVLIHTAAYALGVLCTLLCLGAIVAGLRAAGTAVGWGFQFQEPLFVAGVAMLLVVFALNFFGVFEFQIAAGRLAELGSQAAGARRSFFEGLLVVLLATPCSAPFLGTAVGFAFASPAPVILAIFAAIAAGLAAPMVLIALIPGGSRWLPRSGAWMLHLRTGLGFVLLATTVWLLWIFGRSAGPDALSALLALLVAVAAGVWTVAVLRETGRAGLARGAGIGLAAAAAAGLLLVDAAVEPPAGLASDLANEWAPYDPQAVAGNLAGGRPVFVAFSADWCITCKLNERNVLASDAVGVAFARSDVALFLADWTRRDEVIRSELARFGRASVPLYLYYSPLAPDAPDILPELLRIRDVLDAVSPASNRREVIGITRASSRASM